MFNKKNSATQDTRGYQNKDQKHLKFQVTNSKISFAKIILLELIYESYKGNGIMRPSFIICLEINPGVCLLKDISGFCSQETEIMY